MLRGKHIMVRVGGGWETLQNYLIKHDNIISQNFSNNLYKQPGSLSNSTASGSQYSSDTSRSNEGFVSSRVLSGTKSVVVKSVRREF